MKTDLDRLKEQDRDREKVQHFFYGAVCAFSLSLVFFIAFLAVMFKTGN